MSLCFVIALDYPTLQFSIGREICLIVFTGDVKKGLQEKSSK